VTHIELEDSGIKDITELQIFCPYKKHFPMSLFQD